jgi:hypothetical protein
MYFTNQKKKATKTGSFLVFRLENADELFFFSLVFCFFAFRYVIPQFLDSVRDITLHDSIKSTFY